MTEDADNVTPLGVKPRRDLGDERVLTPVATGPCYHTRGYAVDERLAEVKCKTCGEKLNPIWVLNQIAHAESRFHELHARYQDELQRLNERMRTKCEHCGDMTRISHR